ncbi:TerB family tellurite resistance protein [Hoeflea sp. G2-23]|uniref:TerB family tellurite resistance protein n=1 Tax=Hoeflea algicola TaxID=2983763 RepID=A0ABT3ZB90_9HYPH|nr:TerB family tellurite resistance protein [Hoeflea algicola]MCY0148988.1 TerB family tellurite resistance protein [Hoeflea algicola]
MLEQIRAFLSGLRGDDKTSGPDTSDSDVAAAALFFHVIGADGVVDPAEARALKDMISEEYADSEASKKALIEAGAQAERESVDLYAFTSVLNRSLEPDAKVHFIELLWRLAYADGYRHELEDHVVWRIADLMGVSSRERVLARQRALKDAGISEEGDTGDES